MSVEHTLYEVVLALVRDNFQRLVAGLRYQHGREDPGEHEERKYLKAGRMCMGQHPNHEYARRDHAVKRTYG